MTEAKRRANKKYAKSAFGKAQIKARRKRTTDNLRNVFGGQCSKCGEQNNLHFAHIKPTSLSGPGRLTDDRNRDVKNNPDCYLLLCVECHKTMDLATGKWGRPRRSRCYQNLFL
jgi:hypothetical protein